MADNKIQLPSSGGGLVRYSEEYGSKFKIKPLHVIIILVAVVVAEVLLRFIIP